MKTKHIKEYKGGLNKKDLEEAIYYLFKQNPTKGKKPYGEFTRKDITEYVQSLFDNAYKKTSL